MTLLWHHNKFLIRNHYNEKIAPWFIWYFAASSVSVSAWTLVAISCERYYAICHPLSSRRWQTLSHAYKLIALIWFLSFLLMSPIAALSRLIPTSQGKSSLTQLLQHYYIYTYIFYHEFIWFERYPRQYQSKIQLFFMVKWWCGASSDRNVLNCHILEWNCMDLRFKIGFVH